MNVGVKTQQLSFRYRQLIDWSKGTISIFNLWAYPVGTFASE